MAGRTRDIESWKREKRKLLEGAETKGESRKNKTAREWTKGPQRIAFGRKRGRWSRRWRCQGRFGLETRIFRGEKRTKLENATTRSDARCIGDNKRLRASSDVSPLPSFPLFFEAWEGQVSREYWQGGRSWWLKFDDSNSRFNSVFNWATMNHRSLFARGFALQILGRPSLPPLSTWESILAADYEDIRAWFLPRIKRYLIRIRMEFINLDLSADNCEPTFSSLSPPQPTRF